MNVSIIHTTPKNFWVHRRVDMLLRLYSLLIIVLRRTRSRHTLAVQVESWSWVEPLSKFSHFGCESSGVQKSERKDFGPE